MSSRAPHYDVLHAPGEGVPAGIELRDGVRTYPDSTVKPGHIKVVTTFQVPDEGSNARRVMEGWIYKVWPRTTIEWTLGRLNPRGVV